VKCPLANKKQTKSDSKTSSGNIVSKSASTMINDEQSDQLTNFCWYNFDTNKILVATNSKTLMALNLCDTFILVILYFYMFT
jgi:hypothetical protein